jgi:uncharacterized GH25 family protein
MKRIILQVIVLLVIATVLAACGSSDQKQTNSDLRQVATVNLTTDPEPPMVGNVELQMDILDEKGQPLDGATVDVSADHTDMKGMTMGGLATGQGSGRYAITADFSMSGNWKINVYVRKDTLEVMEEFNIIIQ